MYYILVLFSQKLHQKGIIIACLKNTEFEVLRVKVHCPTSLSSQLISGRVITQISCLSSASLSQYISNICQKKNTGRYKTDDLVIMPIHNKLVHIKK